jgi:hypothetical protein
MIVMDVGAETWFTTATRYPQLHLATESQFARSNSMPVAGSLQASFASKTGAEGELKADLEWIAIEVHTRAINIENMKTELEQMKQMSKESKPENNQPIPYVKSMIGEDIEFQKQLRSLKNRSLLQSLVVIQLPVPSTLLFTPETPEIHSVRLQLQHHKLH